MSEEDAAAPGAKPQMPEFSSVSVSPTGGVDGFPGPPWPPATFSAAAVGNTNTSTSAPAAIQDHPSPASSPRSGGNWSSRIAMTASDDVTAAAEGGGSSGGGDGSCERGESPCAGRRHHSNSVGGDYGDPVSGADRGGVAMAGAAGGAGGAGGVLGGMKNIAAFSPYAARFGGGGGGEEDDLAGVTTRLAGLNVEHCDERQDVMQSPAKKDQGDHGSASAAPESSVARRMHFLQDCGKMPDGYLETLSRPALVAAATTEATAAAVARPKSVSPEPRFFEYPAAAGSGGGVGEAGIFDHGRGGVDDAGKGSGRTGVSPCMGSVVLGGGKKEPEKEKEPVEEKRTLVVYPTECLLHMGGDGYDNHQEAPARLELLCGEQGALRRNAFQGLEWASPASIKPAVITDLLRVHEYDYLLHIQERCKGAPSAIPAANPDSVASEAVLVAPLCSPGGTRHPPVGVSRTAMALSLDGGGGGGGDVQYRASGGAEGSESRDNAKSGVSTASLKMPMAGEEVAVSRETVAKRNGVSMSGERPSSMRSAEFGQRFVPESGYVDVDTRVSRESYQAARMAAGAVLLAVDRVVQGRNPNAFVAVRPPGHHAGPSGSVPSSSFWKNPGMNSSGFCLLNNAAIGAAYARSRYGRSGEVGRVAIVDIDIHHGNGTEEIVRCLRPMTTRLPLPPSWPPVTKTVYKPWLDEQDADNVFFGSVSLQDKDTFYPASGMEDERFDENDNIVNVSLSALGPPPGEEVKKRTLTKTKMTEFTNKAGAEFKRKCQRTLLARLKEFSPDLLIISAGFDGHVEDYYHYLSNETYEWVTLALEECCPSGRVVSVLEGGYSLEARVSRAKAAQQARVNSKKASKPDVPIPHGGATTASTTGSTTASGPALRGRRNTRRTASASASASCQSAPVVVVAGSLPSAPVSSNLGVGAPSAATAAAAVGVAGAVGVAAAAGATTSDPSFSRSPELPGCVQSGNVLGNVPTTVVVPLPPIKPTIVHATTTSTAVVAAPGTSVVGGETSVKNGADAPAAAKKKTGRKVSRKGGREESGVLRPEDGGLVRGVVSHVAAMVLASRKKRAKGDGEDSVAGATGNAALAGCVAGSRVEGAGCGKKGNGDGLGGSTLVMMEEYAPVG